MTLSKSFLLAILLVNGKSSASVSKEWALDAGDYHNSNYTYRFIDSEDSAKKAKETILSNNKKIKSLGGLRWDILNLFSQYQEDVKEWATNNGISVAEDLTNMSAPLVIKGRWRKGTYDKFGFNHADDYYNIMLSPGRYDIYLMSENLLATNFSLGLMFTDNSEKRNNGYNALPYVSSLNDDPRVIKAHRYLLEKEGRYTLIANANDVLSNTDYIIVVIPTHESGVNLASGFLESD